MDAFWIILTGSLVAVMCGSIGCFLILRNMAMVGDAISHAVLPGIVIAYFFAGTALMPMLFCAAAVGVLATAIIETINKKMGVQADAAIGITYTALFAIGVILISLYAGQAHLDQDCVLYGEISFTPLDTILLSNGVNLGPRNVWVTGFGLLGIVLLITIGYKGFFISSFNADYANSIGIKVNVWHYILMSAVSISTVLSFEVVGAILVVAFLTVPPATARLLTNNLKHMLIITAALGITSSIGGYYLAVAINGSVSAAMATVAGIMFFSVFVFTRFSSKKQWTKNKTIVH